MKSSTPTLAAGLTGLALLTFSGGGIAAPCAGFTDVDTSSTFCPNVEWLKNRKVTLGCTTTTYCPNDPVSRLQMAAFMNRLGTALTPVIVQVDAVPGALDLDLSPVVCQTATQNIVDFPRRAFLDATFSGTAGTGVDVAMRVVWSADGGGTWQNVSPAQSVTFVPSAQWSAASDLGSLDLAVGGTARFGVRVTRSSGGSTDLTGSRCLLRASIGSRDGASSPF
jgi:S-layer homology domain